jgi:hypothetical protein
MKKSIVLLFLGFIVLISCKFKVIDKINSFVETKEVNYIPYYLKVYEADSLYLVKDYKNSYKILDSLFKEFKPLNTEQYKEYETYISCAFALRKKINFRDSILKSIENYGSNARYINNDSLMNLAFNNAEISSDNILRSTELYRSKLNLKLRDSIQEMCKIDQRIRSGQTSYNENIKKVDSLNQIKLKYIFNKYGYPHEKLIGEFSIDKIDVNLNAILLHTDRDFSLNFLLPKILTSVKMGHAYPENYAQPYDRFLEDTSGKQLYGSYNLKREKQNTEFIDKKNLDSIRKSIGLPSRTYKKWRFKKKYGIDSNN